MAMAIAIGVLTGSVLFGCINTKYLLYLAGVGLIVLVFSRFVGIKKPLLLNAKAALRRIKNRD